MFVLMAVVKHSLCLTAPLLKVATKQQGEELYAHWICMASLGEPPHILLLCCLLLKRTDSLKS